MRPTRLSFVVLVAFGIAGCGGNKPVELGAVLPMTGQAEIYGQSIRKGIDLAYEQTQARTDLTHTIHLTVVDSGSDPGTAKKELDDLLHDNALAVIGGVTTAEALEMVPVADKYDRVLLSPSASSPELTGISKNFFRVFPSDFLEGTKMGNFASQKLGLKTAVILAKEETYAKGIQEVFKSEFERNGGKVLEVIEFPPGTADFSGLIDRVRTLKPDAVYVAAFAPEIASIIESLRERGFAGTILTTSAFSAPKIIEQVGKAANGVYLTQALFDPSSKDPVVKHFVDAFEHKYGSPPDLYSAHGYDAMNVLVEALEKGGKTPSDLWKGMRAIRAYPGVTGAIQFDEKGDVQKYPRVYVIDNGKVLDYETEIEQRREELLERLRQLQEQRRKTQQSAPPG